MFTLIGATTTAFSGATRGHAMVDTMIAGWERFGRTGSMVAASYALILIAVRHAPVGYVATLRESSVLIAAFLGQRYLDEGRVRQRSKPRQWSSPVSPYSSPPADNSRAGGLTARPMLDPWGRVDDRHDDD